MKKYYGIQALRVIAASLVVAGHQFGNVVEGWRNYAHLVSPNGHLGHVLGMIGVAVFFGISGFIMVTTQYDTFGKRGQPVDFFWRRILRILPLYAIATGLQFINKYNYSDDYTFLNLLKSLLFIPYVGDGNFYRPVLGQGWTLNIEMYFYLIFAISLLLPRLGGMVLCIAAIVATVAAQAFAPYLGEVMAFYADRILLFFVCGMLVAAFCKHVELKQPSLLLSAAATTALLGAAVWIYLVQQADIAFVAGLGLVPLIVLVGAWYQPIQASRITRLFDQLGNGSYGAYLFHGFMLGAFKIFSSRIAEGEWLLTWLLVVVSVILGNVLGVMINHFIERPISRRLNPKSAQALAVRDGVSERTTKADLPIAP